MPSKVYFDTDPQAVLNVESSSFLGFRGMQHRVILPENDCAFFDMGHEDYHYFWMANVNIPLDVIFINNAGQVVDIVENATPLSVEPFTSAELACFVVEVNAGWCYRNNVIVGTKVSF